MHGCWCGCPAGRAALPGEPPRGSAPRRGGIRDTMGNISSRATLPVCCAPCAPAAAPFPRAGGGNVVVPKAGYGHCPALCLVQAGAQEMGWAPSFHPLHPSIPLIPSILSIPTIPSISLSPPSLHLLHPSTSSIPPSLHPLHPYLCPTIPPPLPSLPPCGAAAAAAEVTLQQGGTGDRVSVLGAR